MNRIKLLAAASITGIVLATSVASPAFAWHPQGAIQKEVQNQTAGGALSDANNAAAAVSAKPGDVLRYVITVSNNGAPDSHGYNDMAKTVMTDTLPAGVALISDASQTTITENIGTVKPGQKVTKEYMVKVTSTQDGQLIQNQACFTGNSTANDNAQKGCDVADVKVTVPVTVTPPTTTTTSTPTPAPTTPQVQAAATTQPESLPNTGPGAMAAVIVAVFASAAVYALYMTRFKRRAAHN